MTFWDELYALKRPIVGLSPMDGVTDAPMRYMTAKYSSACSRRPVDPYSQNVVKRENGFTDSRINENGVDLLFTEFVSVDALHHAPPDRRVRLLKTFIKARDVDSYIRIAVNPSNQTESQRENGLTDSRIHENRPYEIAQVFGNKPELFEEAAILIEKLGFDGIDINMGCPAHKVEEHGSGAGLIRTPEVAQEIVRRVKAVTKLPVSVKTRIGVDKDVSEWWMETLMEVEPANITLHGRTLKQLYQGSADWESIGRAAEVVHKHGGHLLGNGDITSMSDLYDKVKQYGVDGGLIGRCAEGNPGIFVGMDEPSVEQRIAWMVEHARVFESIFSDSFMPMRKHLAWYCKGFPGAVEMRSKLMQANSADEVESIVTQLLP